MDSYVNSMQNAVKTRSFRRVGILLAALAISGIFIIALYSWGPEGKLPSIPSWGEMGIGSGAGAPVDVDLNADEPATGAGANPEVPDVDPSTINRVDGQRVDLCGPRQTSAHEVYLKTVEKYSHLRDDKFTIAMQTYKRPDELKKTLSALLDEEIPSLEEVVIVWNDLEENPPADYTSKHGIRVHYKMSARNSLNSRLLPDPDYKTQAILLTDDDVYYHPSDLEFVFQTWRKFGRHRLTGALARCSTVHDRNHLWKYGFCSKNADENNYAMILTNLAFSHIAFMDYYSSADPVVSKIRDYVDEGFNCEDIAMNFVQSYLTREGPLLVTGSERYVNYEPKQGISRKPGHIEARSKCLNDFAEYFSCMPLLNETAHIQRGVVTL